MNDNSTPDPHLRPGAFLRNHFRRRITNKKNKQKKFKSDYLPHTSELVPNPHPTDSVRLREKVLIHILNPNPRLLHQALRSCRAAGVSTRKSCDPIGGSPFVVLAAQHCQGVDSNLKLLVSFGASIDERDASSHVTPLHCAVSMNYPHVVSYLLDAGADPNAADIRGRTPLMIAARKKYDHLSFLLQKNGANPELRDARNNNANAWGSHGVEKIPHDPFLDGDGVLEKKLGVSKRLMTAHMRYVC